MCPYSSAASMQMGVEVVENIGDRLAVILKHHGVVSVGDCLKQALCACVYLEEAAKTYSIAYSMDKEVPELNPEQILSLRTGNAGDAERIELRYRKYRIARFVCRGAVLYFRLFVSIYKKFAAYCRSRRNTVSVQLNSYG